MWTSVKLQQENVYDTDTYFPMNFSQFFLRTHITENFQKTFMQKAASIVLLFKFQIFLQRVSYSSFHVK